MPDEELFCIENGELKECSLSPGFFPKASAGGSGPREPRRVVVPDGVTSIGSWAFYGCSGLTEIVLPGSVTSIGDMAFDDCSGLTEFRLPEGVTSIGDSAFSGCTGLTEIRLPESLTSIGKSAFRGCKGLTLVRLPEGVTSIGDEAFSYCGSLTEIRLPESLTSIGKYAFSGCARLKRVDLPGSVTVLGSRAFCGCGALSELIMGTGVRNVGGDLFADCGRGLRLRLTGDPGKIRSAGYAALLLDHGIVLNGRELSPEDVMELLAQICAGTKPLSADTARRIAGYIRAHRSALSDRVLLGFAEALAAKREKYPSLFRGLLPGTGAAAREAPVEAFVRQAMRGRRYDDRIVKAIRHGIPYAHSRDRCSTDALVYVIGEYARQQGSGLLPDADRVADALDRESLAALVDRLFPGNRALYLKPWARFASDGSVAKQIRYYDPEPRPEWKLWKEETGLPVYDALYLSDTRSAVLLFDGNDDLGTYARMRGKTAAEIRDEQPLPDFDIDPDGKKRYYIDGRAVEACIAPDLSFSLYDVKRQKTIGSFLEAGENRARAEACEEEFAAFKENVLGFAAERAAVLRRLYLSGDDENEALWRRTYLDHPVLRLTAQLIVWQDETPKTFIVCDGAVVDSADRPYSPRGRIRMAHVLDLRPAEVSAWQSWFVRRGRSQPFDQIGEPAVRYKRSSVVRRYMGMRISAPDYRAFREALLKRGLHVRSNDMDDPDFSPDLVHVWMNAGRYTTIFFIIDLKTGDRMISGIDPSEGPEGARELNAVLQELDKATLLCQVSQDNDAALAGTALSSLTAQQVAELLDRAVESGAVHCTAALLAYGKEHFPDSAEGERFSLE